MKEIRPLIVSALSTIVAFVGPLAYGLITRWVFGTNPWPEWYYVLSLGFLVLVPFALGALTVFIASVFDSIGWLYALVAPVISVVAFMLAVGILAWEAWICVAMAAPIFLVASVFGGIVAYVIILVFRNMRGTVNAAAITLILLAPYIITPIESRFPVSDQIRTVESVVVVNASPQTVWENIIRLRPIAESERPQSFFHAAGLPRPLEAMLDREGVGGIRAGQWEDGLLWIGTITDWEPDKEFTVSLEADTNNVHSALPLQAIGGPSFDMVDDRYWIEPRAEGGVNLHLYSTYRLTTRFNAYGGLWVEYLLHDIQNHILSVVKLRAEALP